MILLPLLSLVLLSPAPAEDSSGPLSIERDGRGVPVCGLGREFHAGRRKALMDRVGERVMVFRGLPETRDYLMFRQDKTFWYLTGIESPNAALVLDGKSGAEILFLPKADPRGERWEGEKWDASDEWVPALTGIDDVRQLDELLPALKDVLGRRKEVGISMHPAIGLAAAYDRAGPFDRHQARDPLDGRVDREQALADALQRELSIETFDVARDLIELRWVKQPAELAAMRRAGRAGALAMIEAVRSTRAGIGEWELEALMSMIQVREGGAGPAYHAIVGSGPNSCVLHYSTSSRRMHAGEVVLIDYGPELDHYTTDITRTWPVDGEFTERQAELYDAVLAAQAAGIAAVKPGVTMRDVNAACSAVLRERGFGDMILHGACHWIGMEVHDPGPGRRPLEPGVAFTVEPGLYDVEAGIGIRIEDVVVVTEDGCEVLTDLVPKDRATITALVGETGVLDWLGDQND
jgi:Xaa-Pro aminopeptidase